MDNVYSDVAGAVGAAVLCFKGGLGANYISTNGGTPVLTVGTSNRMNRPAADRFHIKRMRLYTLIYFSPRFEFGSAPGAAFSGQGAVRTEKLGQGMAGIIVKKKNALEPRP